ncbi:MAG: MarR family winged helix-turn-helix transcriptional regulator [Myxococcota bacterium]
MSRRRERTLLERISNLLRAEARAAAQARGLQLVHLDILDYLDRSNRFSNTPAGVTGYLGLTKGTVSQSILRLEERGLLAREADPEDGRVRHLLLTGEGRRVLRSLREGPLEAALREVESRHGDLEERLEFLLRSLQKANGGRSFGVCRTCRYFEAGRGSSFRCGLLDVPLTRTDSEKICREHEAA